MISVMDVFVSKAINNFLFQYSAYDLYRQLLFYGYIFDVGKAVSKSTDLRK